ncbi:hypothetical protein [Deinococcus aquiradiocola]|uniref:Uncharacterized protein n=1 Tax=Deinococcus aquiradiocola TaxID=393059 RepID=A0A917PK10_9DEIO|nr:hypothetical protein [Deinococcus aquiradiocola]GGJ81813.1 hypothetical protein GCM10008939_27200 [Deinococcus aquiradiocola]
MAYRKLSEQVTYLTNPQRSDTFVKLFRNAVREGHFEGAYMPERFQLPKTFNRRGGGESYSREVKEMLFELTPAFEAWFDTINRELAASRKGGRIKPSVEAIEAGLVDFKTMAAQTREKMQASFKKGQSLGTSRARTKAGGKTGSKPAKK